MGRNGGGANIAMDQFAYSQQPVYPCDSIYAHKAAEQRKPLHAEM